jgi:hypothetical protein
MIAVLSATEHDFYAMPLPFVVYSWWKIGIRCIVFVPSGDNPKLDLAIKYCVANADFYEFNAEEKRIPTFSQVSRLFGAAIPMITGDSDLAVFGDYFKQLDDGGIHVVGSDLTPSEQYPMCFIAMPVHEWINVMEIKKGYQEHIADIVNPIEGENVRGTNWCLDQFLIRRHLDISGKNVILHKRSDGTNQFAKNRADRDSWQNFNPYDIIDAHLPRPLTDTENFGKVYDLFKIKFPEDDLEWMINYRNEYLLL